MSQLPEAEIDTREMSEIEDWTALYRPAKRQVSLQPDADIVMPSMFTFWRSFVAHSPQKQRAQNIFLLMVDRLAMRSGWSPPDGERPSWRQEDPERVCGAPSKVLMARNRSSMPVFAP